MACRTAILVWSLAVVGVSGDERVGRLRGTVSTTTVAEVTDPWAEARDGKYFGVAPSDVEHGLSSQVLEQIYGQAAMDRAQRWVGENRVLYCGNASAPDQDLLGEFPFVAPTTAATYWPGACPNSAKAQQLFDKGLAFRFLFNDNEAACAFAAAEHEDPECSMAILAQAYSVGPNVNYAELASPSVYALILKLLTRAKDLLERPDKPAQSEYAPALHGALRKFYCVDGAGALESMLALEEKEAYAAYKSQMTNCTHDFVVAISSIASAYPSDPNLQSIAAGALMQDPAWKWWRKGSSVAGALVHVSLADEKHNSEVTAIKMASELIRPADALAYTAIESALNVQPDHLGALHFAIHSLEQGPAPRWAESVADRLLKYSNHQGHAIHMQTHIATRIGNYNDSYAYNLLSVQADADWNMNRTGGGIMSLLYKYVPHNTAFAAEAAQHMGNFKNLAAAIQSLNYCAGFGMVANPRMASLGNFLGRQMLQPLRFGKYSELVSSLADGAPNAPVSGLHTEAKLYLHLPGQNYTIDQETEGTEALRNSLSDIRLFVLVVANARLGNVAAAEQNLEHLLGSPNKRQACEDELRVAESSNSGTPAKAKTLATCRFAKFDRAQDEVLNSESSAASGTLTINNDDNIQAIYLLVAAAEVARARGDDKSEREMLELAFAYQTQLQYDEPAPFFYPVGETLAGNLFRRGNPASLQEAKNVLRMVLFQWPRSSLASFALHSVLDQQGHKTEAAFALADATRYNDTELSMNWL
jgi:hypothetical protein